MKKIEAGEEPDFKKLQETTKLLREDITGLEKLIGKVKKGKLDKFDDPEEEKIPDMKLKSYEELS